MGSIATRSTTSAAWLQSSEAHRKADFLSTQLTSKSTLSVDSDPRQRGADGVSVHNLDPNLIASLGKHPRAGCLLQSILRVRVIETASSGGGSLPDVLGHHQVLENRIRFIPHFPFDSDVRFRATFDPRPLERAELTEALTLEFSLPRETNAVRARVKHVFPSSDSLPENLLRFYVCFSHPMERGQAEEHIVLLGPDGRPAPDTLYRPPVELWDRSIRHLTILLDPGRLKRGVGPNRELGPPLKTGERYTLVVDSDMVDSAGRPIRESFYKSFCVTEAIRERIAIEQWKIVPPVSKSHQPLVVIFPKPLDWALLWRSITIASEDGRPVPGRIAIGQGERRWSFTSTSPWTAARYSIRIASSLEDVCGNSLLQAFDRPLGSTTDAAYEVADRSMPFQVA